ncbi:MAG: carbohydrate binding domain-containing protein [Ruminococcus sp.]|nr:carbohydrate binding domain-containing protein [Ruminococcus sp.]
MKFSKVLAMVTACVLTVTGLSISSILESHADTEELMNDTFEGSYGAWKGVGASTTLSSDQTNTGDESLYVYDRTASWGAPRCSLSTIVAEGYTYEISGYTYFEGSGSQNVGLKILYTDSDGTDHYDNISYTYVNADTWTQLSGSYTVPTGVTGVTLYIEYSDASTDQNYYIDDIVITGEAVEIELNDSFFCDYEDGTTQSWDGRGSATAELSQTYAYSGESSLFVSGQTAL